MAQVTPAASRRYGPAVDIYALGLAWAAVGTEGFRASSEPYGERGGARGSLPSFACQVAHNTPTSSSEPDTPGSGPQKL